MPDTPPPQFWEMVSTDRLAQGDFLPDCHVPVFGDDFGSERGRTETVPTDVYDLIVISQSCDLENRKVELVACSPIFPISEFEQVNPDFKKRGRWEDVRKGRVEGLHLLASPADPGNNLAAYVVDFREIYSLPFDYLTKRARTLGPRWRLKSPYLEHFSQTFARFFMRVGLPSAIPPFK